jgi:5,10-methylenetetrahydromethanopterin reductase
VLDREGVSGIAELSVLGSAGEVRARLAEFEECGVTDFAAHVVAVGDRDRTATWDLLAERAASPR